MSAPLSLPSTSGIYRKKPLDGSCITVLSLSSSLSSSLSLFSYNTVRLPTLLFFVFHVFLLYWPLSLVCLASRAFCPWILVSDLLSLIFAFSSHVVASFCALVWSLVFSFVCLVRAFFCFDLSCFEVAFVSNFSFWFFLVSVYVWIWGFLFNVVLGSVRLVFLLSIETIADTYEIYRVLCGRLVMDLAEFSRRLAEEEKKKELFNGVRYAVRIVSSLFILPCLASTMSLLGLIKYGRCLLPDLGITTDVIYFPILLSSFWLAHESIFSQWPPSIPPLHPPTKAIRFDQNEKTESILAAHPYMLHSKVFGNHERTCLYVAVFLGKVEVVRALLKLGADRFWIIVCLLSFTCIVVLCTLRLTPKRVCRDVTCNEKKAIDVIGHGAKCNPMKVMRIRALLSDGENLISLRDASFTNVRIRQVMFKILDLRW